MAQFSIKIDQSQTMLSAMNVINETIFPKLNQAVSAIAQQAHIDWKEAVLGAKLWSGEKIPYAQSIVWKMTGPFSAEVSSDYKYAKEIEEGRPAKDLKRMLNTSLKVRNNKNGKRYLIIPFRHQVPGSDAIGQAMPQSVYDIAENMKPSHVSGRGTRLSGTGAMDIKTKKAIRVSSRKYAWGDSVPKGSAPQLQTRGGDRYTGMVRFDTSSKKAQSSKYLTFRVMTEGSPGWIVPAKPGLYMINGIVDRLQPIAEKVFTEAVKQDLG